MQNSRNFYELFDACQQEGCPFCRVAHDSITRYLDSWKYEVFTDVEDRERLRRSQGFCHAHTSHLVRMGASIQLAQAYQAVLTDTIEQLQANLSGQHGRGRRRLFETKRERAICPACLQLEGIEADLVLTLRRALLDSQFYERFCNSQGLCLPHLRLTTELKLPDVGGDWLSLLQKAEIVCLQRLDAQLSELIRKHDYHFKDEEKGDEMRSWQRAAGLVAGEEW
ncbi:MAG TPA: hypothetical protein DHW02_10120 [Ktedonobacter sp.]|nr:hypothetical protein [Ktedonobacter sp.]